MQASTAHAICGDRHVIIDHRTYEIHPEKMREWLALWESKALPIQGEICGGFLGMYVTDVGLVNEVIHLWQFADSGERERRRARLMEDARWQDYLAAQERLGAIRNATSRIIRPTAFSPELQARAKNA
jgi:hypothetical protein